MNEGTHEALWGRPAPGTTAVHHWRFFTETGGTRVQIEESLDGETVQIDVAGMRGALDASLVARLKKLKSHAEQKRSLYQRRLNSRVAKRDVWVRRIKCLEPWVVNVKLSMRTELFANPA